VVVVWWRIIASGLCTLGYFFGAIRMVGEEGQVKQDRQVRVIGGWA